jgi:hypothetical protein
VHGTHNRFIQTAAPSMRRINRERRPAPSSAGMRRVPVTKQENRKNDAPSGARGPAAAPTRIKSAANVAGRNQRRAKIRNAADAA